MDNNSVSQWQTEARKLTICCLPVLSCPEKNHCTELYFFFPIPSYYKDLSTFSFFFSLILQSYSHAQFALALVQTQTQQMVLPFFPTCSFACSFKRCLSSFFRSKKKDREGEASVHPSVPGFLFILACEQDREQKSSGPFLCFKEAKICLLCICPSIEHAHSTCIKVRELRDLILMCMYKYP